MWYYKDVCVLYLLIDEYCTTLRNIEAGDNINLPSKAQLTNASKTELKKVKVEIRKDKVEQVKIMIKNNQPQLIGQKRRRSSSGSSKNSPKTKKQKH